MSKWVIACGWIFLALISIMILAKERSYRLSLLWGKIWGKKEILQLVVIWLMIIAICYVFFTGLPTTHRNYDRLHRIGYIDWNYVMKSVVIILLFGTGLIFTIRAVKK